MALTLDDYEQAVSFLPRRARLASAHGLGRPRGERHDPRSRPGHAQAPLLRLGRLHRPHRGRPPHRGPCPPRARGRRFRPEGGEAHCGGDGSSSPPRPRLRGRPERTRTGARRHAAHALHSARRLAAAEQAEPVTAAGAPAPAEGASFTFRHTRAVGPSSTGCRPPRSSRARQASSQRTATKPKSARKSAGRSFCGRALARSSSPRPGSGSRTSRRGLDATVAGLADRGEEEALQNPWRGGVDEVGARDEHGVGRRRPCRQLEPAGSDRTARTARSPAAGLPQHGRASPRRPNRPPSVRPSAPCRPAGRSAPARRRSRRKPAGRPVATPI